MDKVEFGQGKLFALSIDSDGVAIKDTKSMSAYNVTTRVITIATLDSAKFSIGDRCVVNEPGENNYAGGVVTALTTIEIQDEASDVWIEDFASGSLDVYAGMEVAVFESFELAIDATGQAFKGNDRFDKEWYFTDVDVSGTMTNVLFDPYTLDFFGGYVGLEYFDGRAVGISDLDGVTGKEIKPNDVKLLAIKRRTEDDDKYEECLVDRCNTGDFELPTQRDNFFTNNFTFRAQQKSTSNPDILNYVVQP